jgi:hypothetical protein
MSLVAFPAMAQAPLTFCEKGVICWTDYSKGSATTELRFRAQGGETTVHIKPGTTQFPFGDFINKSSILPSDWLCMQARQKAEDGTLSNWYISDTEGICNLTANLLPPVIVEPPPVEPPPVEPPPVEPPPVEPPPVEPPPVPIVTTKEALQDGLKTCLSKKLAHTACMKALAQALENATR